MTTTEVLYNGYVNVEKITDTIKGKEVTRERVVVDDAVAAVLVDTNGMYGLVKQYRPTVRRMTYELVAGTCDKGISLVNTLVEELEEECGITEQEIYSVQHLHDYFVMVGISDTEMNLYRVKVSSQKSTRVDDADVEEVVWVPFEEWKRLVMNGDIVDSKTLLGFYMESTKRKMEEDTE